MSKTCLMSHSPLPVASAEDYLTALNLGALPDLLTTAKTAELLSVSRQTVYNLAYSGEISAIRTGKVGMRIFKQSLIDYLQRHLV